SDGTSLTVTATGFAHAIDEPVYRVDYNQTRFYWSSTDDSADSTLLTTHELQPESAETRYEDSSHQTGYGFARFYNSETTELSPFSAAIPYTGQSQRSLAKMISKIRTLMDEKQDDFITDNEITDAINDKQRDIIHER